MPSAHPADDPSNKDLAIEVLKVVTALLLLTWIGFAFSYGGDHVDTLPQDSHPLSVHPDSDEHKDICGAPSPSGRAVALEMIYSDEKRDWLELASDRFSHLCPHLQVKLRAMNDIEAADAIAGGQLQPTVWAPTDELALKYLEHRAKQRPGAQPLAGVEKTDLVQSPLVMLFFQDRLRVLSAALRQGRSDDGIWMNTLCSGIPREPDPTPMPLEKMVPGTWAELYAPLSQPGAPRRAPAPEWRRFRDEPFPSLAEIEKWGRVKVGHAPPPSDSAGLAALYLLALDYTVNPAQRTPAQPSLMPEAEGSEPPPPPPEQELGESFAKAFPEKKEALRKWLRRCEAGLPPAPRRAQALTASLFNTGASLYDGVVTYEHLALPFLERVDKSATAMNKLVVIYPQPALSARHPAVLLTATVEQRDAARRWLRFLLSKEMQEKAIELGFRSIHTEVTVRNHRVDQNRFLRLRRHVMTREPLGLEAPRIDGSVVQELLALWSEATGRF